jgi:hypothetical protein
MNAFSCSSVLAQSEKKTVLIAAQIGMLIVTELIMSTIMRGKAQSDKPICKRKTVADLRQTGYFRLSPEIRR